MVDDALLSREQLDDAEWSVTPQPEHLVPDSIERERMRESFRSDLEHDYTDAVVLTHTDADGLSSAAMVAAAEGGMGTAICPLDYHGAYSLEHALGDVRECASSECPVYILDLNADSVQVEAPLLALTNDGVDVHWYDHHQWDGDVRKAVERAGVELVVDEDECTTSLLLRELGLAPDDQLADLAAVTKDRDLWIREDPRSDRLATFAEIAETTEYITAVLEHGPDLPDDVQERIDERQARNEELESRAITRADHYLAGPSNGHPDDPDIPYEVAVTYTRGGRSSEIGNYLTEEAHADIAIVQKPHGGVGIYSHSDRETFARCHEVAAELGGGGHPTAAGCSIPFDHFRDLASYWHGRGEHHRAVLLNAVEDVVRDGVDEPWEVDR